jgi:hypothetical protein
VFTSAVGDFKSIESNGPGYSMTDLKSVTARILKKHGIIAGSLQITGPFNLTTSFLSNNVS